jgi:ectoine hydroxylase-related dioxygenase (phytanoyl-CoA dioxygenase family)
MTLQAALHALGVRQDTLSAQEKTQLDQRGFLPLAGIITPAQAALMRRAVEEQFRRERTGEEGQPAECGQLQSKAEVFDVCVTHPRVLAAVAHVLGGDFVSLGVHSRPNPPDQHQRPNHQALHVDYGGPALPPGQYGTCNSMWPLVDFTAQNGATRVVPGSHRWQQHPQEAMADCHATHPDEVLLIAPVGTVVIFNAHLWHSSTPNLSQSDRPNVTSFWSIRTRHDQKRVTNPLSPAAYERLSEAARALFDPPDTAA